MLRTRLAFTFSVLLMLIALGNTGILLLSPDTRPGMIILGIVAVAAIAGSGLAGAWLRKPSATMVLIAIFTVLILSGAIYGNRGGIPPAFAYLPCIMLGFYQFWGPRSLLVSAPAVAIGFAAVFYLAATHDVSTPYPIMAMSAALCFSCFWLICLAAVFNSVQRLTEERLKQTNHSLLAALDASHAAQRAKSEFLANVGHEVRTPLNGVLGMADVMHRVGGLPPDQAERLDLIRESGATLLELLNEILDQSKIETGQVVTESVDFSLPSLIEKTAASWRPEAESRGLDLHVDLAGLEQADLQGDPLRLRQILNNLVSNALKFTAAGQVTLSTSQVRETGNDVWLTRLEVSDTGTGIPEDKLESIFEAFQQADASITRRYGGTGLGLSISRQLARLMGGELAVRPNPEGGSCFCLTVPLAQGMPVAAAAADDAHCGNPGLDLDTPVSILSVDDVATNHIVLRALLEQVMGGCELTIDTALSGPAAIEAVRQNRYDLIFMDIQMPEMDGMTAARLIRDEAGGADIPVIAVSALEADQSERILPTDLFADILGKPTSLKALQQVLLAWQQGRLA
ncbi:ATP-binding protein [Maricaulis sp.]|uniref:ATP-binding protein n=1 Tax=Maricaulis sp. TaxID=1486257 RepID=UPI0025C70712|nr:ATP-binding protein [Maricaulis sp.]